MRSLTAIALVGVGSSVALLNASRNLANTERKAAEPISENTGMKMAADSAQRRNVEPIPPNEVETREAVANQKHPAEEQSQEESPATSIGFVNTSSATILIYELTEEGQRKSHGGLAPRVNAEFPTTTGIRWVVADAQNNAIAVFIADGQPRMIEINDDQMKTWKQHLALDQIVIRGERGETLQTFCMGPDDNIYALLAPPQTYGETSSAPASDASLTGEVRIYAPNGEEVRRFPLDFKPHRITVAPDGEIVVGGFGVIARFTIEGILVAKHVPPNVNGSEEELRKAAKEAREVGIAQCKEQIAQLEEQRRAQRSKSEMFAQIMEPHQQQLKSLESQSSDEAVQHLKQSLGQVYAITASKDALYMAMQMSTGHGFAVWKMKRDATEGKLIVENLAGCCGHLDIQMKGDNLFVAENSRHRVLQYDADGKKLAQFGRRERGGGDGFGGCCNPMNLYFTTNGELFTAESEGKVKRFTPEGKFISDLATVQISAGCKNVAVGATKNQDRIFVLDVAESRIIISTPGENADASGG